MHRSELLKKDAEDFKKLLEHYIPNKEDYHNSRILNICCGLINEEPVLYDYFKPEKLISIDNCGTAEERAERLGRKSFVRGELNKLDDVLSSDNLFDVIMGRNVPLSPRGSGNIPEPYCYHYSLNHTYYKPVTNDDEWYKIFLSIKDYAGENAMLLLTLLRDDEFLRAREIMKRLGCEITVNEENNHPCTSDGFGAASDKKDYYILIGFF